MKKIIIRFPNWLGDCIMALPILDALQKNFSDLQIHVVVRTGLGELFGADPRVRAVLELDDKVGFRPHAFWRMARKIRAERFDLSLILPESFSSALIFFLAGVPERIGYAGDSRSIFLTISRPHPRQIVHRSTKYLHLLKSLDIDVGNPDFPRLFVDPESAQAAEKLIGGLDRYMVIAPHSHAPSRRWGLDRYARLAARLFQELHLNVVLLGAPDERSFADQVLEKSGVPCHNLSGKSSMLTSYEILRRSVAFIGNDSGAAHLAAASGTYTISISGADNPDETRPLARRGLVIRKPLFCSPCVKNVCPRRDFPNQCMDLVSVDDVFNAVQRAINEK